MEPRFRNQEENLKWFARGENVPLTEIQIIRPVFDL